jgi:hypothetical protein
MKILVVAKNKGAFFTWIDKNTHCDDLNKIEGWAWDANAETQFFYAGHNPERLRGFLAGAYLITSPVSASMLERLSYCCFGKIP